MTNQSEGPAVEKAIETGEPPWMPKVGDSVVIVFGDGASIGVGYRPVKVMHALPGWRFLLGDGSDVFLDKHITALQPAAGYVPASDAQALRAELATGREGRKHLEEAAELLRQNPNEERWRWLRLQWLDREDTDEERDPLNGELVSGTVGKPATVAEAEGRATHGQARLWLEAALPNMPSRKRDLLRYIEQQANSQEVLAVEAAAREQYLLDAESARDEARSALTEAQAKLAEAEKAHGPKSCSKVQAEYDLLTQLHDAGKDERESLKKQLQAQAEEREALLSIECWARQQPVPVETDLAMRRLDKMRALRKPPQQSPEVASVAKVEAPSEGRRCPLCGLTRTR